MPQVASLASFCAWVLGISFKDVQSQDAKMFRSAISCMYVCMYVRMFECRYLYATIENRKNYELS